MTDVRVFCGGCLVVGAPSYAAEPGAADSGCIKVTLSQGVEQIASEDDPLPLPPRKAFAYEMIYPALHRISSRFCPATR